MSRKASKSGELEIVNFRAIKEVRLRFDRSLIVIGGSNGAGKSTVCVAVAAAVGGKRALNGPAVRDGAEEGHVLLTMGETQILRKFNKQGGWDLTYLTVDGRAIAGAQAKLDALTSALTFDPMVFYNADAKKQRAMLLSAAGVDFADLDEKSKELYEERTLIGREREKLAGALEKYKKDWEPPTEEVSTGKLVAQLQEAMSKNAANQRAREAIAHRLAETDRDAAKLEEMNAGIVDIENRIREFQQHLATLTQARDAHVKESQEFAQQTAIQRDEAERLVDVPTADIELQIENAELINEEYRQGLTYKEHQANYEIAVEKYQAHTDSLALIESEKVERLANARLPMSGLMVTDDGVLLNGRPVSVASGAERMRLAMAIALANLNPAMPLLCMDGGEALDPDSLVMIEQMVEAAGAVVLMTRVAKDGTCSVILEDGTEVEAARYAATVDDKLPLHVDGPVIEDPPIVEAPASSSDDDEWDAAFAALE